MQCQVSGFLMGLSVIGSVFNITGIAINHYCYICYRFAYRRLYSFRNTLLLVALIWMLTLLAILPNFFVGSLSYDPRVYSCTFTQTASSSYTVAVVVVHFLVPIVVVTFCYLRIWVLVIQVQHKVKKEEHGRLRRSDLRNFVTMFVVFVVFAICWAPLNLIGLVVAINPEVKAPRIPEWLFVVSYFMAYFNSCLNAICYGLLNQNFRKEYKRIVKSMWMLRWIVSETSRVATDSMRSKPSPVINNEWIWHTDNQVSFLPQMGNTHFKPIFKWACQSVCIWLLFFVFNCGKISFQAVFFNHLAETMYIVKGLL